MGKNADELIEEHQIFRENMMEKVKANIVAAQARQKEQYDKNIPSQMSLLCVEEGDKTQKTSWRKDGFQMAWSLQNSEIYGKRVVPD